ncbi:MAG: IS630 family transposase [Chloroflexota bacterium]
MLFRDVMQTVKAKQLVIVDESSTHLHMYPRYARALCGQRAYATHKRNYGQNISLLAALRLDGMGAAMVVPGGVNRYVFEAYIQQLLLPTLKPGHIFILDNLPAHHASLITAILRTKRCRVLFLPAYSPDMSPIEAAFAKIKQALRKAKADTFDALVVAIEAALQQISPDDAIGFFSNCGFYNLD